MVQRLLWGADMGLSNYITQEAEVRAVVSLLQAHWQFPVDELILDRAKNETLAPHKQCFFIHHPANENPKVINSLADVVASLRDPLSKVVSFATLKTISKQKILAAINRNDVRTPAGRIAPTIIQLYYASEIGFRRGKKLDIRRTFHDFFQTLPATPAFTPDFTVEEIDEFVNDLSHILDPFMTNFSQYIAELTVGMEGISKLDFDITQVNETQWLIIPKFAPQGPLEDIEVNTNNLGDVCQKLSTVRDWFNELQYKLSSSDPDLLKSVTELLGDFHRGLLNAETAIRGIQDAANSLSPYNQRPHSEMTIKPLITPMCSGTTKLNRNVSVRLDNADIADEEDVHANDLPAVLQHVVFNPGEGFKLAIPGGSETNPGSLPVMP